MSIKNFLRSYNKNNIGTPPYEYDFLINLNEKEYPKYLAKIYEWRTGQKLPLSPKFKIENGKVKINYVINKEKCKTFNAKIQYLKLYNNTDLKRKCTDKVTARDYVTEKIGGEYLKPYLQICNSFNEINFDILQEQFVMKCSHGCKWQFVIRNKSEFLKNKQMFNSVKQQMNGWMEQEFWPWEGFELNYKNLEHKILIEPYMSEDINKKPQAINIYCYNANPKILAKFNGDEVNIWDENLVEQENIYNFSEKNIKTPPDEKVKLSFELSKKLCKDFKFVRVDWMLYNDKLYFEELTFSPFSGFAPLNIDYLKI